MQFVILVWHQFQIVSCAASSDAVFSMTIDAAPLAWQVRGGRKRYWYVGPKQVGWILNSIFVHMSEYHSDNYLERDICPMYRVAF